MKWVWKLGSINDLLAKDKKRKMDEEKIRV